MKHSSGLEGKGLTVVLSSRVPSVVAGKLKWEKFEATDHIWKCVHSWKATINERSNPTAQ